MDADEFGAGSGVATYGADPGQGTPEVALRCLVLGTYEEVTQLSGDGGSCAVWREGDWVCFQPFIFEEDFQSLLEDWGVLFHATPQVVWVCSSALLRAVKFRPVTRTPEEIGALLDRLLE